MKFNLTVDKKAEAVINRNLCINCGKCGKICPTQAIGEYQKTVSCVYSHCSEVKKDLPAKTFADAKKFAVKTACTSGCPLGIIPQTVAALIRNGDMESAYEHIADKNPMPWVCASVCEQMCQESCKRGLFADSALNMKALERYIISGAEPKPVKYINRFNERIAVIGGGPAGLTAAYELSKAGYRVTIFEKDNQLGGALNWGVPAYRLDKQKLYDEIDRIIEAGIEVRYDYNIGKNYTVEQIWDEGFSAALLAVGASSGHKPDIYGADAGNVYDGVSVMRQLAGGLDEGIELGEHIVVAGGGNLAADASRLLRRLGKDVICVAAEDEDSLHIKPETMQAMLNEGVDFRTHTVPKQIIAENGKVKVIELAKTALIDDERGRPVMSPVRGSEYNVFCDTVIFAGEQKCSVEQISKVETYPDGKVRIDERYRTNKDRIFACGDATAESASVVEAMAEGKAAAAEIDAHLRASGTGRVSGRINNAPDGQTIYPENIQKIIPQFEAVIREGEAAKGGSAAGVQPGAAPGKAGEYVTDVMAILREAGIREQMPNFRKRDVNAPQPQKVAVVGGGIAGISAAISLAERGFKPVIFEKTSQLGGSLRWFATDKRIDKKLLAKELAKVESSGIEVVYNATAGVKPLIQELKAEYDAVLFAIGESEGFKPEIQGVNAEGVFDMPTLISRFDSNEQIANIGPVAIVAGEDDMSFDIARKLCDYCEKVTLMAPCSKGALHIASDAVNVAVSEGVNIVTGVELTGLNSENGVLSGADFRVIEKKVTMNVPCDTIVIGGARPETGVLGIRNLKLDLDEKGYIAVDEKLMTSVPGVFAVGDFDMSAASAGRECAAAVENYLTDAGNVIDVDLRGPRIASETYEVIEGEKQQKTYGFETGRAVFDDRQAVTEASRCLQCGYHREDPAKCMGCGICAEVCPVNAITLVPLRAASEEV